jgi:hypothetical protein
MHMNMCGKCETAYSWECTYVYVLCVTLFIRSLYNIYGKKVEESCFFNNCLNEPIKYLAQVAEFPLIQDSLALMDEIIDNAILRFPLRPRTRLRTSQCSPFAPHNVQPKIGSGLRWLASSALSRTLTTGLPRSRLTPSDPNITGVSWAFYLASGESSPLCDFIWTTRLLISRHDARESEGQKLTSSPRDARSTASVSTLCFNSSIREETSGWT